MILSRLGEKSTYCTPVTHYRYCIYLEMIDMDICVIVTM
jgi:hypothetical protein